MVGRMPIQKCECKADTTPPSSATWSTPGKSNSGLKSEKGGKRKGGGGADFRRAVGSVRELKNRSTIVNWGRRPARGIGAPFRRTVITSVFWEMRYVGDRKREKGRGPFSPPLLGEVRHEKTTPATRSERDEALTASREGGMGGPCKVSWALLN